MLDEQVVAPPVPAAPVASTQQTPQGQQQASDVKNITQKMKNSGITQLLQKINTPQELQQFLADVFASISAKMNPQQMRTAIQNAAKQAIKNKV